MEIYNHVTLECPKLVHVGCHVWCHVLPNLTSDMVLGMDWLHSINHWIDWNVYSLSLDYGSDTVCILGTKKGCSRANIEVCALKLVLKTMCCDKVSAWFGLIDP